MDKAELRKTYLRKRKDLSPREVRELSEGILLQFKGLPFERIEIVHFFYPIVGKHEFNTLILADWLKKEHPSVTLALSRSNTVEHTLEHYVWDENTPLKINQWGITEPESGRKIEPEQIDMVLIPLLAYDCKGNRVGYGKGFYDRFLAECRPDASKVGVSFFPPENTELETNEFDIPLDHCITPHRLYSFSRTEGAG